MQEIDNILEKPKESKNSDSQFIFRKVNKNLFDRQKIFSPSKSEYMPSSHSK
jgi:hypothetical protein